MSVYAIGETRVANGAIVDSLAEPDCVEYAWLKLLAGLLDATMRESWLPMGFRSLVVQELPRMRSWAGAGADGLVPLLDAVSMLRLNSEPYKVFAKRSAAFVTLRKLEAELKSCLAVFSAGA